MICRILNALRPLISRFGVFLCGLFLCKLFLYKLFLFRPFKLGMLLFAPVLFISSCQAPLIDGGLEGTATRNVTLLALSDRYKNNILSLSSVIQHNPDDPSAYNMRGTAHGEARAYEKAIADFSKAIEIDPSYYQAFANRALIFVRIKRFDLAMTNFEQALTLSPEYPIAYYGRALLYRIQKKNALALADLTKTLEFAPDHGGAYFNRAQIYLQNGDNALALADFNSAIDLQPESSAPYYGRGLSRIAMENYKDAYDDFYVAARRKKNFYQAWAYRGLAAEKQDAPKEAMRAYQRALSINPRYKPALEGLERVKKIQS